MALNIFGAIVGAYFAFYLSSSKNLLSVGGALLFGFGSGSLILAVISNTPLKRIFSDRINYLIFGLLFAAGLSCIILYFIYLIDSSAKKTTYEDLAIRIGVLLAFWLCYLWDKSKKIEFIS